MRSKDKAPDHPIDAPPAREQPAPRTGLSGGPDAVSSEGPGLTDLQPGALGGLDRPPDSTTSQSDADRPPPFVPAVTLLLPAAAAAVPTRTGPGAAAGAEPTPEPSGYGP